MTCLGEGISPQGIYLRWTKLRTCAGLPFWGYQSSIPKLGFRKVAYEHPQDDFFSNSIATLPLQTQVRYQRFWFAPAKTLKQKIKSLKTQNIKLIKPVGSMYGFPWKTGIFTLHLPQMYGFSCRNIYHFSMGSSVKNGFPKRWGKSSTTEARIGNKQPRDPSARHQGLHLGQANWGSLRGGLLPL